MEATERFRDLLLVPFKAGGEDPATGLDCWGQCVEILRREGIAAPQIERALATETTADHVLERIGDRADEATKVGDILFSLARGHLHVATLIDPQKRLAMSVEAPGGAYVRPARLVEGLIGVYRVKRSEAA